MADYIILHPAAAFAIALITGFVPVLLWLWFFDHEDKHPEPRGLALLAFIGGIVGVACVIPFEEFVLHSIASMSAVIILWAIIEEVAKYLIAWILVLRRAENDEPIDSMMYMITVAAGFSAAENVLFIIRPLLQGDFHMALSTISLRFFASTLIHIIGSGVVGYGLAASFHKSKKTIIISTLVALCTASLLHGFFNLTILEISGGGIAFLYLIWLGTTALLLIFERVKHLKQT